MSSHLFVVIPAYNEAENLSEVLVELSDNLAAIGKPFSVLVVDDGSTDSTASKLADLTSVLPHLSFLRVGRKKGKANALRAGFARAVDAGADLIVMMDADGQDNPVALSSMLAEIEKGADLVTAARTTQKDRLIKRTTSKVYNAVTRFVSGAPGSDFNSGFKVMKAPVAKELIPLLYGELHRYITVLAFWFGFKTSEVTAEHRSRLHGKSKYGIARFWRGFLDLITVRFIIAYESRPFHIFGGLGFVLSGIGLVTLLYLTVIWLMGEPIGDRPLLIAGVLFFIAGLQTLFFGLLAELVVFFRFQEKQKR